MNKPQHLQVAELLTGLSKQIENAVWDHYEAGRDREALQAAIALKEFSVRFKDSGTTAAAPAPTLQQLIENALSTWDGR